MVNIKFDIKDLANKEDSYPLVKGDTVTCDVPAILKESTISKGRIHDTEAVWDRGHDGVGNYAIENNKLVISYDDGYIDEKNGRIIVSELKFSGHFDFRNSPDESFEEALSFGNATLQTKFKAFQAIRELTIKKYAYMFNFSPSASTKDGGSYKPLDGTAKVENGYIFYNIEIKAGDRNNQELTNVIVKDWFDEDSLKKIDVKDIRLNSAFKKIVGRESQNITEQVRPTLFQEENGVGWNIGELPPGAKASLSFKVRINKKGITEAVKTEKDNDPSSDALEARTLRNTASAIADKMKDPVKTEHAVSVKNFLDIDKDSMQYDQSTFRRYFKIIITAPHEYNSYTMYNVPIYDHLQKSFSKQADINVDLYRESGIESIWVTHWNGTKEKLEWDNFTRPNKVSWKATLPVIKPGDKVEITSYLQLNPAFWSKENGRYFDGTSKLYIGKDRYNFFETGEGTDANGYLANDLPFNSDYEPTDLEQEYLNKFSRQFDESEGTIPWIIRGNQYPKDGHISDVGGEKVKDTIGEGLEFMGQAEIIFSGLRNNEMVEIKREYFDLDPLKNAFEYVIPKEYGKCSYEIRYKTKVKDPTKTAKYSNTFYEGDVYVSNDRSVSNEIRDIYKIYIEQDQDWAEWETVIPNRLHKGDVYVDTCNLGEPDNHTMYFTKENLEGISLNISGVEVDKALYEVLPEDEFEPDKFKSFKIKFLGDISVIKEGKTLYPGYNYHLYIRYKTTMVNPSKKKRLYYYNYGTLTLGSVTKTCWKSIFREDYPQIEKEQYEDYNNKARLIWTIRVNKEHRDCHRDGTVIIKETLPKGTEFVSAWSDRWRWYRCQSSQPVKNSDGTTTVTIKVYGLTFVDENHGFNSNDYSATIFVEAKATDDAFLCDASSTDFTYVNKVTTINRFGMEDSTQAEAIVKNSALKKQMDYDEATAPYARFTVEVNKNALDVNSAGDTLDIVDVGNENLTVNTESIQVLDGRTNQPVQFSVDATLEEKNQYTITVPDKKFVKIIYTAQVKGDIGERVLVENQAYFKGKENLKGPNAKVSQEITILKAQGQATTVPMVWLLKKDESASLLGGARFSLSAYDREKKTWEIIDDSITSLGKEASNNKGKPIEVLYNTLYKLEEKKAPDGYLLNDKPYYFALYGTSPLNVEYPAEVSPKDVFKGPSGSKINFFNKPYTKVSFSKVDSQGFKLEGAQFSIYVGSPEGPIAKDSKGKDCKFTSLKDQVTEICLAPGMYFLKETKAPDGYALLKEAIPFEVKGDKERQVLVQGKMEKEISVINESEKRSISVEKTWLDFDNKEKKRTDQVEIHLLANGVDTQKKLLLSERNNWKGSFENLDVMKDGKEILYRVKEMDSVDGYMTRYLGSAKEGFTIVNTLLLEIEGEKTWINDESLWRPETITIRLKANGKDKEIKAVQADQEGKWKWTFSDLPAYDEEGAKMLYTITEDSVANYLSAVEGFDVKNTYSPEKTSLTVSKVWEDGNNQDGKRPGEVIVKLLANGEETGESLCLNEENKWTGEFKELNEFKDGKKISYSVQEEEVGNGYQSTIKGNMEKGFTITNTLKPRTINIEVKKVWEDKEDKDRIRPKHISIKLLADGVETDKVLELTEENQWTGGFKDLDEYKAGKKIAYSVKEEEVSQYQALVSGDMMKGFVITNILKQGKPDKPDKPNEPDKPDKPNEPDKPDKPDKPEKPDKPDKPDKPSKPIQPDKPEKPDKPDKPDKPAKPEDEKKPRGSINPAPNTSDPTQLGRYVVLLLVSFAGACLLLRKGRQKK
ncbi:Cna B-type domain-containing protein [Murdochiella massiliensis]|uniref:Cna B-type domain-containing protein n=1 Tax=Murdochiella massiliensis TaxID=1673723 RepID=UPI00082FF4F8|nr:Cna B-type domain-containing protein [Murdochiella massiliensis]